MLVAHTTLSTPREHTTLDTVWPNKLRNVSVILGTSREENDFELRIQLSKLQSLVTFTRNESARTGDHQ